MSTLLEDIIRNGKIELASALALSHTACVPKSVSRALQAAQSLIRGVLPFMESEVYRWAPDRAAELRSKMPALTAIQAALRLLPCSTSGEEDIRLIHHIHTVDLIEQIGADGRKYSYPLPLMNYTRELAHPTAGPAAIESLGTLCYVLCAVEAILHPPSAEQQVVLSSWLARVDALFTRLCSVIPRMQLTRGQARNLLYSTLASGALQLIPALSQRQSQKGTFLSWRIEQNPFLTVYCDAPHKHVVSHEPYFRLFEFGLDPTEVAKQGGKPLSALQLARKFVREHSPPAAIAASMAAMQSAVEETRELESRALPSILAAFAVHHWRPLGPVETQRRETLHAQFMHALIPAWLAHSTKVRALLLAAAPDRLIPPLVDIVSCYLDLEGVPPERSAPA